METDNKKLYESVSKRLAENVFYFYNICIVINVTKRLKLIKNDIVKKSAVPGAHIAIRDDGWESDGPNIYK